MTEEQIPSMEEIDREEESVPSEEEPQEPEQAAEPEQPELEEPVAEEPKRDRVQERINQLTAKFREEERKRQELEARLEAQRKPEPELPVAPDPDNYDYDSDYQKDLLKYNQELIDYKVNQRTQEILQQTRQAQVEAQRRAKNEAFGKKVDEANIEGYQEALDNIANYAPLRPELVDVIQDSENGPQIVHFLGTNLDVADRIANIQNPVIAAMEIGKISAGLNRKPQKQTTKATRPIEPVAKSGASLKLSIDERVESGDTPSMDEIWDSE